jgi:caa(3)-type oxidase subunit IV
MNREQLKVKERLLVYGCLILLLGAAVGVSFLSVGSVKMYVVLVLVLLQAMLILFFFLHIGSASRLTWIFVGASLVWLGILFVLVLSDYLTRGRPASLAIP